MAKYRIAWMPGDGVGHDVMEAARLVLDRMKLDAEYVPCDIGWEFCARKATRCPIVRLRRLRKQPADSSARSRASRKVKRRKELAPELKGQRPGYFSPIVGLRQMFNLHTNMRPCKSYHGNPSKLSRNNITNPSGEDVHIDQVVFRENTEGMYGGVEFFPLPEAVYTALSANPKIEEMERQSRPGKYRALDPDHEQARLH